MDNKRISASFPYQSRYVDIHGSKMHYIDEGRQANHTILFLHAVPASCYVWRNILPYLTELGRCVAPDLIGMGKSEKPDIPYLIQDHANYLEKFIDTLNLKNLVLVMHGWGSIIGFDYAMRHPGKCKGLVFYESYLRPYDGDDVSLPFQQQISELNQQDSLVDLVMNTPYFIDTILPLEVMRSLTPEEITHYREPYQQKGSGKALCGYLQELPGLNQNKTNEFIANYSKKLIQSTIPKLMLYSIPGFITTMSTTIWAKKNLSNLEVVEVGEEFHYAQESNPALMGEAISIWLQGLEQHV